MKLLNILSILLISLHGCKHKTVENENLEKFFKEDSIAKNNSVEIEPNTQFWVNENIINYAIGEEKPHDLLPLFAEVRKKK